MKYHTNLDTAETHTDLDSDNPAQDSRFTRLKKSVVAAGGNAVVATRAHIGTSTLSGYMNNSEWKLGIAEKVAEACGVSLPWLLFGTGTATNTRLETADSSIKPTSSSDAMEIRYYNLRTSTNFHPDGEAEAEANQFVISRRFLRDALNVDPDRLFLLKITSDCMAPTIMPNDTLLVDASHNNELFGVHVLQLAGRMMVKRLALKATGVVTISSDNHVYPGEDILASQLEWFSEAQTTSPRILGRVVYKFRALF